MEGSSKKGKGLMDTDNTVGIVAWCAGGRVVGGDGTGSRGDKW